MKKEKLITVSILPIMWLIYFCFELITGRLTDSYDIIMNLLPIILFALVGLIIYTIGIHCKKGLTSRILGIIFAIVMLLDQGIKLIIKLYYFNDSFYIIPRFLSFNPIINSQGSWLNARFGAGVSFTYLIILNIIALFLFIEAYRYYLYNGHKDFWADMCFVFIVAGCLCSLIDKVFYGGSLDFIGISNLFVADLKDIYINLAILFFALTIYFNGYWNTEEGETTLKEDMQSLKRFISFIKKDLFQKK